MTTWAMTGGSGFLGLHLLRRLRADGARVRSLDVVPCDDADDAAVGVVGDVREPARARELCAGADVVVHAAAALPIRGRELRDVNVGGTATLLAAALEAGVRRAVFISSAVVYGIQRHPPATEETPPAPIEPYGRSKVEAEDLCRAFGKRGLEVVVLRPQAFVGPGRLGIFGILFEWVREGRRIYVLGPGTNRYQLLAVEDLVDAIVRAADAPVAGETFNVGAAGFGTVEEELGRLIERAGSSSRLTRIPAGPSRLVLRTLDAARLSPLSEWHYRTADRDCHVDVSKAERLLGWRATRSSSDALVEAYDWYAANRNQVATAGTTHRAAWNERALGVVRRMS
jgi:nucleoside-diphosphate-sugar epimerase